MNCSAPSSVVSFSPASTERASTGISGLDDILGGGFPRHRLYLVQGDPGVGKTTLALQFLFEGVRVGEAGLYITLSETRDELMQVARSHGWDLDSISILEMDTADALSPDAQNTLFHPSEVELGETTAKILAETDRVKPARVVFDSLSEVRLLAGAGLRYRRHILALKQHFAQGGATVLFLDDLTASPERELQSLAHGVITLEHIKPEYGAERRRLFVNKMRGTKFRGGYHDFMIQVGGIAVFPRLVAAEHFDEFEREAVRSGLDSLDQLSGGGLLRGTSTLIMGAAGVGKTTLALQYLIASLRRGENAAFFAFGEGIDVIIARAKSMNIDLRTPIEEGKLLMHQVDPADLSPGEFAHRVRDAVENKGVKIVVIDSLNGYLYAMPEERYLILHMHELLTYLNQKGVVTILVTAQSGLMGSQIKSPIDMSYLADSVLLLRHFEALGVVRLAISMIKKRSGAHERSIRELFIEEKSVHVGPPLTNFRGILTGVPEFLGEDESLMAPQPSIAPDSARLAPA
ncbi:circadian clock protein KaiC [Abditibacterium utsteinense]|uniref:non-specific serine/threonine protein kinase n=1 Tax=Abditibacterium utsteinense TaxID=1960156 RepID=A0A2S8SPX0_9BACT|nr:ATPase domain-containing protein [Abditibacterium utsteinense]PQV62841.1 circadian clock protein KaiC [Abditibacterium utsteinense]